MRFLDSATDSQGMSKLGKRMTVKPREPQSMGLQNKKTRLTGSTEQNKA